MCALLAPLAQVVSVATGHGPGLVITRPSPENER